MMKKSRKMEQAAVLPCGYSLSMVNMNNASINIT